jgi:hypothetical protein
MVASDMLIVLLLILSIMCFVYINEDDEDD